MDVEFNSTSVPTDTAVAEALMEASTQIAAFNIVSVSVNDKSKGKETHTKYEREKLNVPVEKTN